MSLFALAAAMVPYPWTTTKNTLVCTNFTSTKRADWVKEQFGVELPAGYPEESYPGFSAPVVVKSHQTGRVACGLAKFGLIPSWAKDDKIGRHTYNARSETAAEKPSYRMPLILGHDVAGVVVSVGSRVSKFKPGDEVYARPDDFRIGSFAELIPVKEASLALKPQGLTMEEAASVPLVGLTAWQALVEVAQLKRGQKVFIQAGSGGVGTFAIQLAKHLGATVATTTSTANVELVKALGADVAIDYKTQDFEEVLKDYDVVLHSQDAKTLENSMRVLKRGGKLVSISGPADPSFAKQIEAPGFVRFVIRMLSSGVRRRARGLGIRFAFLFMRANGAQLSEITSLIEQGIIRPVIDKVFPFAQANEALAYVEGGRAKGKVVVSVRRKLTAAKLENSSVV